MQIRTKIPHKMTAELFLKHIKKQQIDAIVDLVEDQGLNPYQWSSRQHKGTFHVLCQFFQPDIFKFVLNKCLVIEDLDEKWHQVDINGSFPHHLLGKN